MYENCLPAHMCPSDSGDDKICSLDLHIVVFLNRLTGTVSPQYLYLPGLILIYNHPYNKVTGYMCECVSVYRRNYLTIEPIWFFFKR